MSSLVENNQRWIGCGNCDPEFSCFNGETRCIRMPHKQNIEQRLAVLEKLVQNLNTRTFGLVRMGGK
jgi:hypothetical protein